MLATMHRDAPTEYISTPMDEFVTAAAWTITMYTTGAAATDDHNRLVEDLTLH